ncbi:fumarylacetoacetase [Bacillus coahuilensis m2-6]|uniref:fumarylacetoacetate hydrolase family protein n=1 Tax=Bacillus coahuilensis TaxID=408580 RepID=UPI00075025DB|nr:fumarylacetoacetate hydrolase family protein [Bacillus coahuilensis]KUP09316.1 fumarylacetoacetase [Bacillus coahuilensis m2-6]
MKFVTFQKNDGDLRAGILVNNQIFDLHECSQGKLPLSLLRYIEDYQSYEQMLLDVLSAGEKTTGISLAEAQLVSPLPKPQSVRDFYAFLEHVKQARARRGLDVIPEWFRAPVFYFTNHLAVKGPGDVILFPENSKEWDYELEVACIIGKQGRNISREQAMEFVFGFCIMNDWSARDLQREEMKVGLGPAKGKDFATTLGPWIVTKNELSEQIAGDVLRASMTAKVNGKLLSSGNAGDMYFSFGELIEQASKDVTLYPGEVIGSGTVGSGCLLELGTEVHRWLETGDVVELEIEGLGVLRNSVG